MPGLVTWRPAPLPVSLPEPIVMWPESFIENTSTLGVSVLSLFASSENVMREDGGDPPLGEALVEPSLIAPEAPNCTPGLRSRTIEIMILSVLLTTFAPMIVMRRFESVIPAESSAPIWNCEAAVQALTVMQIRPEES